MALKLSPSSIQANLRQQWPNIISEYLDSLDPDIYEAYRQAAKNLQVLRATVVNWYSGDTLPDAPTLEFALHLLNKEIVIDVNYGAIIQDKVSTVSVNKVNQTGISIVENRKC